MSSNIKRDNHYVPQMYLKRWSDGYRINTYSLLVPHENVPLWKSASISHIAYLKDLYVRVSDGNEKDDFEIDFNKRIETPAAQPLTKLSAGQKITAEEWTFISDYILAQYVRTLAFYHSSHNQLIPIVEQAINELGFQVPIPKNKKIKQFETTEETRKANSLLPLNVEVPPLDQNSTITNVKIETVIGKNLWLMAIHAILQKNSKVLQFFRSLKWSKVICHPDCQWPTSDNPVVIINNATNRFATISKGLSDPFNVFIFPISPSIALLAKSKGRFDWVIEADKEQSERLTRRIINNAFQYVFSNSQNEKIPLIRPRIVNREEFLREKEMYENWYNIYQEKEGPYLSGIRVKRD